MVTEIHAYKIIKLYLNENIVAFHLSNINFIFGEIVHSVTEQKTLGDSPSDADVTTYVTHGYK